MKAVFDGLFTRVMLDKSFIQQQITHRSFRTVYSCDPGANFPLLQLHHRGGIDTPEILAQIIPL